MRRWLFTCLAASACLLQVACISTSPRYQPAEGELSDVGPALNAYSEATVPREGLIVVEGDGFAYGVVARAKGAKTGDAGVEQAKRPFPATLSALLGVRVENRGAPGQTLEEGERLWVGKPCGDLLILAYGYDDARAGATTSEFVDALARRITEAHAAGAAVILVSPPHFKSKRVERAAETERAAMRAAQANLGVGLVDLAPIVAKINPRPTSGAFQSQDVYTSAAYAVAAYIAVARGARPSTGPSHPRTPGP